MSSQNNSGKVPSLLPNLLKLAGLVYLLNIVGDYKLSDPLSIGGHNILIILFYWFLVLAIIALTWQIFTDIPAVLRNYVLQKRANQVTGNFGNSYFASPKVIKNLGLYQPTGLFLGACAITGRHLFRQIETNFLLYAPAGGGKTISWFITNLLHYQGSTICADLKGPLYEVTAKIRQEKFGHEVFYIDPANITSGKYGRKVCYNPLKIIIDAHLNGRSQDVFTNATNLGLEFIPKVKNDTNSGNEYFRGGSRNILIFTFVYFVIFDVKRANFANILKLIQDVDELVNALYEAVCSDVLSGDLADIAKQLLSVYEKQDRDNHFGTFIEGARQVLNIYNKSGYLSDCTSDSDFSFADLKERNITLYMIVDPTRMQVFAPWLSLLGWCMTQEIMLARNSKPVLFLLDEASNFKISNLIERLTELREFGLRIFFAIQSFEAMEKAYSKEDVKILVQQCECQIYVDLQSYDTAKMITENLGKYTIKTQNYALGHSKKDKISLNQNETGRSLLNPRELLESDEPIILSKNAPPIRAKKIGYHEVMPWCEWAEINPFYGRKFIGKRKLTIKY